MQSTLGQPYYHLGDKWVVDDDDDDDDVKVMKQNIKLRKKVTMVFWKDIIRKWWRLVMAF